jgi:hypothetical protein
MIGPAPDCYKCKHLHPKEQRDSTPMTCAAFFEGIPNEIFFQGTSHKKPYRGDKGFRFEPKEEP